MKDIALAAISAFLFTGCAGMDVRDNEHFLEEATQIVLPGMSYANAVQRLSSAGFVCDEHSAQPTLTCNRTRYQFLYTCVDRINLTIDDSRTRVSSVDPRPIACAGF
jgi:hypothetical protein